jgi:hypothetical protein
MSPVAKRKKKTTVKRAVKKTRTAPKPDKAPLNPLADVLVRLDEIEKALSALALATGNPPVLAGTRMKTPPVEQNKHKYINN